MRTLARNKQKMWYSLFEGSQPQYVLDEDGRPIVIYIDDEGIEHYEETGEVEQSYSTPISFEANISSHLNEMHLKAYGVDQSGIYCEMVVKKGYVPLKVGAVVWRENEIGYKNNKVDISTADYTVMGIMTEFLHEDWYLLQRNNSDGVDIVGE